MCIRDRGKRLVSGAAVALQSGNDLGPEMRAYMKAMGQEVPESHPQLELNPSNPVSYTHLYGGVVRVQLRLVQPHEVSGGFQRHSGVVNGNGLVPVSYTHLDVYKRQAIPRRNSTPDAGAK